MIEPRELFRHAVPPMLPIHGDGKFITSTTSDRITRVVQDLSREMASGVSGYGVHRVVKVTSALTGGGKYNGKKYNPIDAADYDASADLNDDDLGSLESSEDCIVWNLLEWGQNTHYLTMEGNENRPYLGFVWRHKTDDGKEIIVIFGVPPGGC